MEDVWSWSVEELAAWASAGKVSDLLKPRIASALPHGDALREADPSALEDILYASGEAKDHLTRLFAASALLGAPSNMPWGLLQDLLPEVPLMYWRHGTWRLAPVPCMGHGPMMITLLCGYSTNELPSPETANFSPETQGAVALAAALAARKWDGHFACWHWSGKNGIVGASLGLPVFLGFGCAAEGLPMPQALATGKLDPTGAVEPVENVENKASLAGDRSFFVPEGNYSNALTACIPVRHIDETYELWKNCGSGKSPDYLRTLQLCLNQPERLFTFLISCTEAEVGFLHTDDHIKRIRETLKTKTLPVTELRSLLVEIATSRKPSHNKVRNLMLKIFPHTHLHSLAEKYPALAWRLSMLHIRAFNHSGHPNKASELRAMARPWERELEASDIEEELISYALYFVGLLHNTYRFRKDPWEELGSSLTEPLRDAERRAARGRIKNKHLGDWYGTLAQHHAFRGELSDAEKYLEKAIECFEGRPEDQRRSLSCRFFARLDAGKPEALGDLLNVLQIKQLDQNISSHIQEIDNDYTRSWALFALARYAVDSEVVLPALRTALAEAAETLARKDRIWGMTPEKHPWQLILYNLGFLAEKDTAKWRLWRKSLNFCLHNKSGPTINVMALLPLSAMKFHELKLPEDVESRVSQICDIIREGLDITHFEMVLSAPGWAEALDRVMENKVTLFPFNYR